MTRAHHTCDGCGLRSAWTRFHAWYGALRDLDGGDRRGNFVPIIITCSDECRRKLVADGRIPENAEWLD